ncbi:MAG: DNA polymerase III subunit chi [Hyphomicrobiales bacterium]
MTEVLFYHLERKPLEQVLPQLLEKTLERDWRAVVQASSPERVEALTKQLWTYNDSGFLPHGSAADGDEKLQPVFLTETEDNPNGAHIRFFVDGADGGAFDGYERVVFMFDGNDADALATARERWKAVKATGLEATYWQQNDAGGWVKKA